MRSGRLVTGLWVVVLVAAAAPPAMADTAPWLSPEWTVRRVVDIKMDEPRQPGGEVAACAFYTGGLAKPDSSDVRVAVGGRQLVNSRILQTGPGDLVRLAFEVLPNEKHYYVYYGNPKADAPKPWQPQRGVMLEVRRWPGGPAPQKFEQLQAAWAKAKPLGADFVSRVSLGFNPFAESDTPAIYHYTGWFVTPDPPGTYPMDISTNGASWLLVDGKERIARPGSHGPIGHSRRPVPVPLPQGVHRLDFWNANDSGPMMNLAAWQPPEAKGFEAIPAKVFLPVTQAALIETDVVGQKMAADFFAENAGETWWPDRYAVRMRLKNLTKGAAPGRIGRAEWDFGDGQTSELASPLHVYLAPGDYTVTLRQTLAATSSTFRTKVRVERNWWKQMDPAIEPIAKYADEAAQYNFQKLDVRGLTAAVSLFQHESRKEALAAAAAELALKRPEVEEAEVLRVGLLLGDALRNLGKAQEAVAAYRQLEGRAKMPTLRPAPPSRSPRRSSRTSTAGTTPRRNISGCSRPSPPPARRRSCGRPISASATSGDTAATPTRHARPTAPRQQGKSPLPPPTSRPSASAPWHGTSRNTHAGRTGSGPSSPSKTGRGSSRKTNSKGTGRSSRRPRWRPGATATRPSRRPATSWPPVPPAPTPCAC